MRLSGRWSGARSWDPRRVVRSERALLCPSGRRDFPAPPANHQMRIAGVHRMDMEDRFLGLLDEHRRILFKVARAYGRGAADREDLVQETVLQLWRSFGRYDARLKFSTWMYRIALNVAISHARGESRRSRASAPSGARPAAESILSIAAPEPAAPEEDVKQLNDLIAALGPLDRALILLYLDGERHDAIAEVLGISVSNVGT